MNEKLQKLTTYIRGSQVFHTLEKNHGTGVTPSQHSNPCEVLLTQIVVLLPRPESGLFLVFPAGFLSKIYTTSQPFLSPTAPARHGWLIPFHLTTALAGGSSAGSSSFWCLEKTLEKEAKLPFWRSLWEPLHIGCSCWYSRESGKIVVNPPRTRRLLHAITHWLLVGTTQGREGHMQYRNCAILWISYGGGKGESNKN